MSDYDAGSMTSALARESSGKLDVNVMQPADGGDHLAIIFKASEPGVIRANDKSVDSIRVSISGADEIRAFFDAVAAAVS